MRARLLFALTCLTAPLALAEDKKPAPIPVERSEVEVDDPKLKAAIDDCIKRGVAWLKAQQKADGSWPGVIPGPLYPGAAGTPYLYEPELSGLALLALLKCEVPPKDPCIVKGFAWLEKQDTSVSGGYGPAICLMALEAKHAPKEAVGKKGEKKAPSKPKPIQLEGPDAQWAARLTSQLTGIQSKPGGWRYANVPNDLQGGKPGLGDVSCTQYALMGLKTARHMGIPVKAEVFYRAADFLLGQQEADGKAVSRITQRKETDDAAGVAGYSDKTRGWPYLKGAEDAGESKASGAMTCAGTVGMLICRSECLEDQTLEKKERTKRLAKMEQAIYDGLAWLDANWSTTSNPPRGNYELGYYLYGLERVGVVADLRMIGPKHDWYVEGARFLTERIQKDGNEKGFWAVGQTRAKPENQETPYALLFLRKASIKVGYPVE